MSGVLQPGYKQTETDTVSTKWKQITLGEAITFQRGYDLTNRNRKPGNVPVISSSGRNGTHNEAQATGPGIVIGRYGTIGEVFFIEEDFWPHNTTLFVKDFKGNNPRFLSFLLNTIDYKSFSGKSGVPGVNRNDLHEINVSIPLLPEQRAIAAALGDVDALIASLDQLIAKKCDLKQAAMQQLLTGKQRLPEFSGEWEMKKLGKIANIQRGASPRPIDSPVWFDQNSSVGWVRISDVTKSGKYLLKTTQRLSLLGILHSRPVRRGNLIMSICATVGRPIITEIDTCIHDGFVVFDNLQIDKHFLYYILTFIEDDWSRHGQTGSQMNLNTGLINRTEFLAPTTHEEQKAIAGVLSDMDAEITALAAQRDKTRVLKQGMMQELLTGRIRLLPASLNSPAKNL